MNHNSSRTISPLTKQIATWTVCIVLLATHAILGAGSIRNKTNTVDELNHLTAGYTYWSKNDFRLDPENGNLPQRWEALPLLAMDLRFPPIPRSHYGEWFASYRFFSKVATIPTE